MSQRKPDGSSDESQWREYLSREWEQRILEDDEEFDLQVLAAYADDNVTDQERRDVEKILARSPAALELLVILRQRAADTNPIGPGHTNRQSEEPTVESSSGAPEPVSAFGARTARPMRRLVNVAAAAGLLIAAGLAGWALQESRRADQLSQQIASLDQQLLAQAEALTVSQRENLLLTASTSSPHFFAGPASQRLLEAALTDDGSRGRGEEIPEVQAVRRRMLASARRSLSEWQKLNQNEERPAFLISQASLEIVAGALDAANSTIRRLSLTVGDDAPVVRNLRAGRLLALAETQSLREGDKTRETARSQLEQLTKDHPKFADGWLNLALLLQRTAGKNDPATQLAWNGYLKADDVPEQFRATVKQHLKELEETQ